MQDYSFSDAFAAGMWEKNRGTNQENVAENAIVQRFLEIAEQRKTRGRRRRGDGKRVVVISFPERKKNPL